MIQFNLLPDVKQEYLKAKRTKQLVVFVSIIASGAALTLLILLFVAVNVVQKKSIDDADDDITTYSTQLKAIPNIDKILTVQNQLNTLTGLHDDKIVSSRLFGYLQQLTPSTVSISSIAVDFVAYSMTMTGAASSLDQVNVYTDTLKETTFKTPDDDSDKKAFSDVVLTNFGRDSRGASYTINLVYAPEIFQGANDANLTVPSIVNSPQQQLFQKKVGN